MSKFVDEILESIKKEPTTWKDYNACGVEKGNIKIYGYGNTKLLSICSVKINDKEMPVTYMDRWRIEKVISEWYRTVKLETLLV